MPFFIIPNGSFGGRFLFAAAKVLRATVTFLEKALFVRNTFAIFDPKHKLYGRFIQKTRQAFG